MNKAVAALMAVAISATTAVSVSAADLTRMHDLGTCLAFSYVANGLDGKLEVPAELLPGIMAIKDEFMFEASINGLDDNAAQTYVVDQLTEQNRIKELKGIEAVREKHVELCTRVAESLAAKSGQ
ncbi:hypothetical protein G6L37_05835 [Agrobacterium rubi]|nr:hypothetical protein [Agrobacterium rubi]NTF24880.1 hypothetical protein [Agrobacterium rubi]